MGRPLSFGNSSGKRVNINLSELATLEINAGKYIDAITVAGIPVIGKPGVGATNYTIQGGAVSGIEFVELQSVIDTHDREVMNFMCLRDRYGKLYDIGTSVNDPHSQMKPHGNPKYLLKYVNYEAYIQGIGFEQTF